MSWLKWIALWEVGWWLRRRQLRDSLFKQAQLRARALGRPLVVVGAPDQGWTAGPGCGDVTIDIAPSQCPNFIQADLAKGTGLESNSSVVFVSCVLEYVEDFEGSMRELHRIAGAPENLFVVLVAPWTLAGQFYPGVRRSISEGMLKKP